MKELGIITIYGDHNYGNKLQNYALLTYIKKSFDNVNVSTIYNDENITNKNVFKDFLRHILKTKSYSRYRNFKHFNQYLNLKNYKNISFDKDFNYIVIGSDQVWNYTFSVFNEELMFAKKFDNCKKISYSASIGLNKIEANKKKMFHDELKCFSKISVREDSANTELKKITKRNDIVTLIDPTMLLTVEEWNKIILKPKKFDNQKYILLYFLGNITENKMDAIKNLAIKNNYKIINILDKNSDFFTCGPREFLFLEKNASLICTDSFHSSVFAFLYNKPFIIFDRDDKEEDMSSRLDNLIDKFKLKNRKYNGKEITKENLEHDYSEAYKILETERKKSETFLKSVLEKEI